LDRRLNNKGINFIRYVDDFRIFTKDAIDAQKALETLNKELSYIGLALNDSKVSLQTISDAKRKTGKALVSGEDVDISISDYADLIPMNFIKSKKASNSNEELSPEAIDAYSKYEAGEQLTEQKEVKLIIRQILESEDFQEKKKIIDVLERYLSFTKFICSYCEKDCTEFKLKKHIFDWFLDNILSLPDHAIHALFGMASHNPELKERAVREILMVGDFRYKLDSFIFREALVLLRTNLSKDDLEDLIRDIMKFDNWTKRAIAFCIWKGNQFSQKVKRVHLLRIAANHNDIFLEFLSQVRNADIKKVLST